jgi:acyl-CoA reductase-like NAD-dependent aldehyde dehydrogenase
VAESATEQPFPAAIPCVDPATGERLGDRPALSPAEVSACVERARAAHRSWRKSSFSERRRVLRRLLGLILEQADELCEAVARDSGKTLQHAMMGEVWPVCEKLRWTIAHGEKHLRPEPVSSGPFVHKRARVELEPLGVVGIITPWNYPFQNLLGPTIPALFAGNAAVVKVSEWVAWSAERLAAPIRRALLDCGHSPDLVIPITGYGDTGAALVRSGVDKIVFTGSAANGRRVVAASAERLVPLILELGGKDPMIVCDDADLDQAAQAAAAGVFLSSGQMCLAAERIYVADAVHDAFVDRVVDIALRLRQGPPLAGKLVDVGAMTMPAQIAIVDELVRDAVARGATVRVGGEPAPSGRFYPPTILTGVDHSMKIARAETFGPVMCVFRVADDDEAIRRANESEYGLGSYVFTRAAARGRAIGRRLVAGSTCINAFALNYMVQDLPFGGVRASGFGRLNGREGLRAMCNVKAVVEDRLPLHRAPRLFPGRRGDYEVARAALRTLYGEGLRTRLLHALELGREWLAR